MSSFARQLSTAATALASDIEVLADPGALLADETTSRPTSATGLAEAAAAAVTQPAAPPRRKIEKPSVGAYMFGVTLVLVSAFELGAHPTTFFRLYTFLSLALLTARFYFYRREKTHLFLLDMCYLVNIFYLYHLWFKPTSLPLRRACFAFATGPLALSVPTFRNSLVFHSADKMTSLFIHIGPALVAWAARWHPGPLPGVAPTAAASAAERACAAAAARGPWWAPLTATACRFGGGRGALPAGWNDATLGQLVGGALFPWYFSWFFIYALLIFGVMKRRIERRGYQTLFGYYMARPTTVLARAVSAVPPWAGPVVYMGIHALATTIALCLSVIWWHSYVAHSLFVIALVGACARAGGTFYLDYLLRVAVREAKAA